MTQQDAVQYVNGLLNSKEVSPGLSPLEIRAVGHLRQIAIDKNQTAARLQELEAEMATTRARIVNLGGQSEALVGILSEAEDARMAEADKQ